MNIGIEQNTKLIYEATIRHCYPVWPSPVLFQVVVASEEDEIFTAARASDLGPNSLLFREETYNSSSRVRRGRLCQAHGKQDVLKHRKGKRPRFVIQAPFSPRKPNAR